MEEPLSDSEWGGGFDDRGSVLGHDEVLTGMKSRRAETAGLAMRWTQSSISRTELWKLSVTLHTDEPRVARH